MRKFRCNFKKGKLETIEILESKCKEKYTPKEFLERWINETNIKNDSDDVTRCEYHPYFHSLLRGIDYDFDTLHDEALKPLDEDVRIDFRSLSLIGEYTNITSSLNISVLRKIAFAVDPLFYRNASNYKKLRDYYLNNISIDNEDELKNSLFYDTKEYNKFLFRAVVGNRLSEHMEIIQEYNYKYDIPYLLPRNLYNLQGMIKSTPSKKTFSYIANMILKENTGLLQIILFYNLRYQMPYCFIATSCQESSSECIIEMVNETYKKIIYEIYYASERITDIFILEDKMIYKTKNKSNQEIEKTLTYGFTVFCSPNDISEQEVSERLENQLLYVHQLTSFEMDEILRFFIKESSLLQNSINEEINLYEYLLHAFIYTGYAINERFAEDIMGTLESRMPTNAASSIAYTSIDIDSIVVILDIIFCSLSPGACKVKKCQSCSNIIIGTESRTYCKECKDIREKERTSKEPKHQYKKAEDFKKNINKEKFSSLNYSVYDVETDINKAKILLSDFLKFYKWYVYSRFIDRNLQEIYGEINRNGLDDCKKIIDKFMNQFTQKTKCHKKDDKILIPDLVFKGLMLDEAILNQLNLWRYYDELNRQIEELNHKYTWDNIVSMFNLSNDEIKQYFMKDGEDLFSKKALYEIICEKYGECYLQVEKKYILKINSSRIND